MVIHSPILLVLFHEFRVELAEMVQHQFQFVSLRQYSRAEMISIGTLPETGARYYADT